MKEYKKELAIFLLLIITIAAASYIHRSINTLSLPNFLSSFSSSPTITVAPYKKTTVHINKKKINVKIAETPRQKEKGLSGISYLSDSEGMLFPFEKGSSPQVFWMKDMKIPIDILWIKDNVIIQIDKNVSPEPDTPLFQLTTYSANTPVDYVLEIAANASTRLSLKKGDTVYIEPY